MNEIRKITIPLAITIGDKNVIACGGLAASRMKECFKAEFVKNCGESMDDQQKETFMKEVNPKVIFVEQYVLNELPVELLNAVLYHEDAHCIFDHNGPDSDEMNSCIRLVVNVENEMEADRYSAEIVGAKTMRKAIEKLLILRAKKIYPNNRFKRIFLFLRELGDPVIQKRLNALRKLEKETKQQIH